MQTRYRAAATALLLTAAGGLAATQGAADASGTHHTVTRAATRLTVTITSTKSGGRLSSTTFRPGKTVFKVVRGNAGGSMQVLRLKSGYSLKQAGADFGTLFGGPGDPKAAIRRVDRNVVFYGGIDVPAKGAKPNYWGTDIDKSGKYYVLNTGTNANIPPTAFHAKGTHQTRSLPGTGGFINMADNSTGANVFRTPKSDPHRGWMRTTNHAQEPHFVVLNQVTETTTRKDVSNYFASNDPNPPSFALAGSTEANIISPGHTFVWKYGVPQGKYLVMCFWPSKMDGVTPHAVMGMFRLFHLS